MANRKIKISQLTELVSASLTTTLVGVENGVTYRMDLDTVADAITSKVNISDRSRIDALEAETGSYLTSLPNDVVSGSDQLTSSYDSRYILSGSITQTTWDNIDGRPIGLVSESTDLTQLNLFTESIEGRVSNLESATGSYLTSLNGTISSSQQITDFGFISESVEIPLGTISGSSQLTSSFDERYTLSSSYSADSSSFDSRFNGLVTTGSNIFTGTNTFNGATIFGTAGGDEGGEIQFGIPDTNTTLSTIVVADIFQNRFRIFEGGGNNRGVFIDLSKTPNSVGGEITWKASGIVDAGTFVTLDNLKATVTSPGPHGLSLATTTESITYNISATYGGVGGVGGSAAQNQTLTTTPTSSIFGWNFAVEGEASTYVLVDKTNRRIYRITLSIGPAYLDNFISIERLH